MPPEIDETTLTAYALNELNAEDRSRVESFMAEDPIAQQTVADIQATAAMLSAELANELQTTPSFALPPLPTVGRRRLARTAIGLAAAAAIAAGVGVYVHVSTQRYGVVTTKTLAPLSSEKSMKEKDAHQQVGVDMLNPTVYDSRFAAQANSSSSQDHTTFTPPSAGYNTGVNGPVDIVVGQSPVPNTAGERFTAGRNRTVASLVQDARNYYDQGKYSESLTVIGNIQKLDPTNAYVNDVHQMVQDKAFNQEQRKYHENYDAELNRVYNATVEKPIPYEDIVRYAPDWPRTDTKDQLEATTSNESGREYAGRLSHGQDTEDSQLPPQLDHHLPELRFNANSLADVIDFMRDVTGENIYMDWPALNYAGITKDSPVTLKLKDVRVDDAVELILKSVSTGPVKAGYKVEHGIVSISVGPDYHIDHPIIEGESYARITDNPFLSSRRSPLSTFAADVDTASYANVRRFIEQGQLPPADAVRIEELINYFPYDSAGPKQDDPSPIGVKVEVADCPWQPAHRLARIALKAKQLQARKRPPSNLTFLIDISGSMSDDNKLPLLKQSYKKLVSRLSADDRVSIVTYASTTQIALPSTPCGDDPIETDTANDAKYNEIVAHLWRDVYAPQVQTRNGVAINLDELKQAFNKEVAALPHARTTGRQQILNAVDNLNADGSTDGGDGIQLAYKTATDNFIKGGVNRIILATDGDFNVGIVDPNQLTALIEKEAQSGVYLTVLGVGMGNVKDSTMEKLADHGKGNYAYLDSVEEADKVLGRQINATLVTVAKDVKLQVEFNPTTVAAYRLIGYEHVAMPNKDFNNDQKTAGEMGAGHSVVALYELIPASGAGAVIPLKYQPAAAPTTNPTDHELMTVNVRYQPPEGGDGRKLEVPVIDQPEASANASSDFRFSAAVASFGMILRNSPYRGEATIDQIIDQASAARGEDVGGYRSQFIELAKQTKSLCGKREH